MNQVPQTVPRGPRHIAPRRLLLGWFLGWSFSGVLSVIAAGTVYALFYTMALGFIPSLVAAVAATLLANRFLRGVEALWIHIVFFALVAAGVGLILMAAVGGQAMFALPLMVPIAALSGAFGRGMVALGRRGC